MNINLTFADIVALYDRTLITIDEARFLVHLLIDRGDYAKRPE